MAGGPAARRILAAGLLLLAAPGAWAQEAVHVTSSIDRDSLTIDEHINYELRIELIGPQQGESVRMPEFNDFISHQLATISNAYRSGGVMRREYIYTFQLSPKRTGKLRIPPAMVVVKGQQYPSLSFEVDVQPPSRSSLSPGKPKTPAPAPGGRNDRSGAQVRAPARVFLSAEPSVSEAYEGEQILLKIFLYFNQELSDREFTTFPQLPGFWVEKPDDRDLEVDTQRVTIRNMAYLKSLQAAVVLFPIEEGRVTVPPFEMNVSTWSFFGVDREMAIKSDPEHIRVLPLPTEGRPRGFRKGNVGRFSLTAEPVNPIARAGDALRWVVKLQGEGNIRQASLAPMEGKGDWKILPPKIKHAARLRGQVYGGVKTFEFLLTPLRGGTLTLPRVRFDYFDPQLKRYFTTSPQPASVTVMGEPDTSGMAASASSAPANAPAGPLPGGPLDPPPPELRRIPSEPLWSQTWFVLALLLSPAPLIIAVLARVIGSLAFRRSAGSRRRMAIRAIEQAMKEMEASLKRGDANGFYSALRKLLDQGAWELVGASPRGMTRAELIAALRANSADPALAGLAEQVLDQIDLARFTPGGAVVTESHAAIARELSMLMRDAVDRKHAAAPGVQA